MCSTNDTTNGRPILQIVGNVGFALRRRPITLRAYRQKSPYLSHVVSDCSSRLPLQTQNEPHVGTTEQYKTKPAS